MKRLGLLAVMLLLAAGAYFIIKPDPGHASEEAATDLVISHKTAGLEYPENAEEGFRASLAMDVGAIEMDVHMVRDGRIILHHDPVLSDYNCFAKGDKTRLIIAEQTLESLAALDCWNHKVNAPYRIATLDHFLEIYRDTGANKKLLIEIKVWDELIENNPLHEGLDIGKMHYPDAEVARSVYSVLRRFPEVTNVQFNTFSRSLLLELRRQKRPGEPFEFGLLYKGHYSPVAMMIPALVTGSECYDFCWTPDYEEVRNWLDAHDINIFIPHFAQATSLPFRRGFQRHILRDSDQLTVIPWTLNEAKDWSKFETGGFDGILTDRPTGYRAWAAD